MLEISTPLNLTISLQMIYLLINIKPKNYKFENETRWLSDFLEKIVSKPHEGDVGMWKYVDLKIF